MSEEEKKAIEYLKQERAYAHKFDNRKIRTITTIALKLIRNQQKELDNLKEIEKSHQKENGELRVEFDELEKTLKQTQDSWFEDTQKLEQEKVKNKELEKQINLNKKTVEIAQTQILEYSQGYKDGLNKEATATAIVARELELNFIRQEIKHKYISKYKIIEKLQELENKSGGNTYHVQSMINAEKNILKELLEEK